MQDFNYAPPVKETDVVDNLTTDDSTKVLSAKQGKVLNDNKQDKIISLTSSVLSYAANLSTDTQFVVCSTGNAVADNPTNSGSYIHYIYRKSSGCSVISMHLASRDVYINAANNGTWSGWDRLVSKSDVSDYMVVATSTENNPGTFNAGSTKSIDFSTTKSGYTRIGIVGITGSGNSGLVIQDFYPITGGMRVYFRNVASNAITPTKLEVTVLYRKDL